MKRIAIFLIFFLLSSVNILYSTGSTMDCTVWNNTITLNENIDNLTCLTIENGANVDFNGYNVHVSNNVSFNGGSINLNGGSFSIGTYLMQVGGTIDINGGICDIGTFLNHLGGTININKGTLTVNSYLLQTNGTINLGDGIGTVKGNLNQSGGTIDIDNGTLEVFGNDNITGTSYFIMNDVNDNVTVYGDFIMQSDNNHNGKLTEGTLEIKGDFTQKNGYYSSNFKTTNNHTVILSGNSLQTVSFDSNNSNFNILILKNSNINFLSETKTLKLIDTICNDFTLDFDNLTTTYNELVCGDNINLLSDQIINKDFTFKGEFIKLNGHKLTITGNFEQLTGNIQFDNGTLLVEGDYNLSGNSNISMNNPMDKLTVKNNMTLGSDYNINIYNGEIILHGSLTTQSEATTKFYTPNKLLFKGDSTSYISNTNPNTQFGNVEIYNNDIELSEDSESINVVSLTDYTCLLAADNPLHNIFQTDSSKTFITVCANKQPLILNDNDSIYGSLTLDNSTLALSDNLTVPGNLNLFNSKLIIQNYKLNVHNSLYMLGSELQLIKGNLYTGETGNQTSLTSSFIEEDGTPSFIQDNSTVVLDNATLLIYGDYIVKGNSLLSMSNEEDYILVNDNFTMASDLPQKDNLTAGTFELKGNLFQQNGNSENLVTSGTLLFKLTGESKQTIQTASSFTYFENLKLENSNISVDSEAPLKVNNLTVSNPEILYGLNIDAENIIDNSGKSLEGFDMELFKGWNLVSDPVNNSIDNLSMRFKDNISVIWQWSSNTGWAIWTPDNETLQTDYLDKYSINEITTIEPGDGFWIKLINIDNTTVRFYGDTYSLSDISTTSSTGWQLIGCGDECGLDNLTSYFDNSIETVWRWDGKNQKWLIWSPNEFIQKLITIYGLSYSDNDIKRGEGFWLYLN